MLKSIETLKKCKIELFRRKRANKNHSVLMKMNEDSENESKKEDVIRELEGIEQSMRIHTSLDRISNRKYKKRNENNCNTFRIEDITLN